MLHHKPVFKLFVACKSMINREFVLGSFALLLNALEELLTILLTILERPVLQLLVMQKYNVLVTGFRLIRVPRLRLKLVRSHSTIS
jgi:hypothetical protein